MNNKTNYQPISLLPIVSKIFEKVIYSQLETSANKVVSPKFCGFRKGHSSQNAFFFKLIKELANVVGTVLMDLSKVCDCLPMTFSL